MSFSAYSDALSCKPNRCHKRQDAKSTRIRSRYCCKMSVTKYLQLQEISAAKTTENRQGLQIVVPAEATQALNTSMNACTTRCKHQLLLVHPVSDKHNENIHWHTSQHMTGYLNRQANMADNTSKHDLTNVSRQCWQPTTRNSRLSRWPDICKWTSSRR